MNKQGLHRAGAVRVLAAAVLIGAALGTLAGCVAMAGAAVASGTMMAMDRRPRGMP